MALTDNINRVLSTLASMLHTRLELMSVEFEEELLRFSSYFIFALIALFCAGVAIALGIILVLALFWDDHRIAALLCLIGLFGAISIFIAAWLRKQFLNKPRLLEQTMAELKKDVELISRREPNANQEQP
jgi:uncharacterized membrane protein YqjE